MENESKHNVHTELAEQVKNDPALRAFNAKKQLEAQLFHSGESDPYPVDDIEGVYIQEAHEVKTPQVKVDQENNDGSITVRIKPKNTTIELTFKSENPKGSFSIKLPTVDVTVTEDSITTIILPEVELIPPTLVPLTVKVNRVSYSVIYAGSTCTLNKLRFISFVRVQDSQVMEN